MIAATFGQLAGWTLLVIILIGIVAVTALFAGEAVRDLHAAMRAEDEVDAKVREAANDPRNAGHPILVIGGEVTVLGGHGVHGDGAPWPEIYDWAAHADIRDDITDEMNRKPRTP